METIDFKTQHPSITGTPCVEDLLATVHSLHAQLIDLKAERDAARDAANVFQADRDRLRQVLLAIAHPKQRPVHFQHLAIMENMRLAALAALDGRSNDENDPLAALEGR